MGIYGIRFTDSCVRITQDSYKAPAASPVQKTESSITSAAAPQVQKSLGDLLKESFYNEVSQPLGKEVTNGDKYHSNPFSKDGKAPGIEVSGWFMTPNKTNVTTGNSGPSLPTNAWNATKWFFGTAIPLIWGYEPMRQAVRDAVDTSVKVVTEGITTAATAVASGVVTAAKSVASAATSTWNWVKSWF